MEVKGPPKDAYELLSLTLSVSNPPDLVASLKVEMRVKGGTVVISARTGAAEREVGGG